MSRPALRLSALLILVCLGASCSRNVPLRMEFVLGTVCSVNLFEQGRAAEYDAIFARLRSIQALMSANEEGTDLDRVNKNAGIRPVAVPEELLDVLEASLRYAELSGGAFDPTVGPLVKLWGIGSEDPRVPGADELGEALSLVDWRDLVIDRAAGTAFLRRPGQSLDLGAIAKGYAADQAVALLPKNHRAIIDLGGNIFALGERSGHENWRIGVQDPLEERGVYLGVLQVKHKSIVTSGVYERYFEEDGERYHHILSTTDGRPVQNGLLSVTIIADRSIDADALSTAAFALGEEKGRALIEAQPNVEAVFVTQDRQVILSSGAGEYFTLTGEGYYLMPINSISNTR